MLNIATQKSSQIFAICDSDRSFVYEPNGQLQELLVGTTVFFIRTLSFGLQ